MVYYRLNVELARDFQLLERLRRLFGKKPGRRPLFFIEDSTGAKIGYTYKDEDVQVLIDLKGNIYKVPGNTPIRHACRLLLKHLRE